MKGIIRIGDKTTRSGTALSGSVDRILSELAEFERRLPAELIFHPREAELLLLLKIERGMRNQR